MYQVYTDRSKAVLLALCRLLNCCTLVPGSPNADKWAELALYRFEGVSDSDLLTMYVPLLHLCIKLCQQHEQDTQHLEQRLESLHRQGIPVTNKTSLADALASIEDI